MLLISLLIGYSCNSHATPHDGRYTYNCTIHINIHTIINDSFTTSNTGTGTPHISVCVCVCVCVCVGVEIMIMFVLFCKVLRSFIKEWIEKKAPPFGAISRL